ncbi:hypothetical protein PS028_23875, partial [Shigella sonnei]|nr:hypothetical protein [Shigella sonnei]
AIFDKLRANIILNAEKLKEFPLRSIPFSCFFRHQSGTAGRHVPLKQSLHQKQRHLGDGPPKNGITRYLI